MSAHIPGFGELTALDDVADAKPLFEGWAAACKRQLGGNAGAICPLVSGKMTIVSPYCIPVPESGTVDDMTAIANDADQWNGQMLLIGGYYGNTLTIKNTWVRGVGLQPEVIALRDGVDFVMTDYFDHILFRRAPEGWTEIFRSKQSVQPGGKQLIITSGNFTVPAGVTKLYVTPVGGGGGGGGGSTASGAGAAGIAGGITSFGVISQNGGGGGYGGATNGRGGLGGISGGENGQNAAGTAGGYGGRGCISQLGTLGQGGDGGAGGTSGAGGGGGGVSLSSMHELDVTPGQVIAVTIGPGGNPGAGATGANFGGTGGNGAVLVEW